MWAGRIGPAVQTVTTLAVRIEVVASAKDKARRSL